MELMLFKSTSTKVTRKQHKEKANPEDIAFRKSLRTRLSQLKAIDKYLYSEAQLAAFWREEQQIRCLLGFKYETYCPYKSSPETESNK